MFVSCFRPVFEAVVSSDDKRVPVGFSFACTDLPTQQSSLLSKGWEIDGDEHSQHQATHSLGDAEIIKLRNCAASLLFCLAACEADPLTDIEEANLRAAFDDLPGDRTYGVIQNLRFANLYSGGLSLEWSPALGSAISEAHFDLDFIDENYDLATHSGSAAFLQELSRTRIRARLLREVNEGPGHFEQTEPVGVEPIKAGRKCAISGGSYSRNGERPQLIIYAVGSQAGMQMSWDGWPGSDFPRVMSVAFGDQELPMMTEYQVDTPKLYAQIFSVNDHWMFDGMMRASEIIIGEGTQIAPLELPTGELYDAAIALRECVET